MLEPRITQFSGKLLFGHMRNMSFAENSTRQLWQGFMPMRKQIDNIIGDELYSVQRYPPGYFSNFDPLRVFEKWAAVEVSDYECRTSGMLRLTIEKGLYAVFVHQGPANEAARAFDHIFLTWLPNSGYLVDNRYHFEVMGEKYKPDDPQSEEEVWVPIKPV